jgi:hypothetical protein
MFTGALLVRIEVAAGSAAFKKPVNTQAESVALMKGSSGSPTQSVPS